MLGTHSGTNPWSRRCPPACQWCPQTLCGTCRGTALIFFPRISKCFFSRISQGAVFEAPRGLFLHQNALRNVAKMQRFAPKHTPSQHACGVHGLSLRYMSRYGALNENVLQQTQSDRAARRQTCSAGHAAPDMQRGAASKLLLGLLCCVTRSLLVRY